MPCGRKGFTNGSLSSLSATGYFGLSKIPTKAAINQRVHMVLDATTLMNLRITGDTRCNRHWINVVQSLANVCYTIGCVLLHSY